MTPTREEWRSIPGYEGFYEASDQGRIRSVDRVILRCNGAPQTCPGRILAPTVRVEDNGVTRCMVGLSRDGAPKTRFVHALVLEAFTGPRPTGADICHGNGNGADNRLTNLRYDTRSENIRDAVRHGTHHAAKKTHCLRGHLLAGPNLVPSYAKRGYRNCLACDRARCNVRVAMRKSLPHDMQKWSDDHYTRIMGVQHERSRQPS